MAVIVVAQVVIERNETVKVHREERKEEEAARVEVEVEVKIEQRVKVVQS